MNWLALIYTHFVPIISILCCVTDRYHRLKVVKMATLRTTFFCSLLTNNGLSRTSYPLNRTTCGKINHRICMCAECNTIIFSMAAKNLPIHPACAAFSWVHGADVHDPADQLCVHFNASDMCFDIALGAYQSYITNNEICRCLKFLNFHLIRLSAMQLATSRSQINPILIGNAQCALTY